MLISLHPNNLQEIVPIGLANYHLGYAYIIQRCISDGITIPLGIGNEPVFYCSEEQDVIRIFQRMQLSSEYRIQKVRMLMYFYEDDPHAFSLDDVFRGFDMPRVRIRTSQEVHQLLQGHLLEFVFPLKANASMTSEARERE